jgi:hypothetical protein
LPVFFVNVCDQPIKSGFFAHSDVSMPKLSIMPNTRTEVIVMGKHEFSGQHGFICGFGEYIHRVATYQVELGMGRAG